LYEIGLLLVVVFLKYKGHEDKGKRLYFTVLVWERTISIAKSIIKLKTKEKYKTTQYYLSKICIYIQIFKYFRAALKC